MNWLSGIFVYIILWWLVLFMVLPWGVRVPDEHGPGHATSAPSNPRLWLKAGITSLVAAVLWLVVYAVMAANLITFRPAL